jgi:hypothetical protein
MFKITALAPLANGFRHVKAFPQPTDGGARSPIFEASSPIEVFYA